MAGPRRGCRPRCCMRLSSSLLLLLLALSGCADDLLLHPSTGAANAGSAERRTIDLHGRTVEVFVAQSPGAKESGEARAYALEFCGNASRAEDITDYVAKRWGDRPVEVWVMNYPGFGGSTGAASRSATPAAALARYDALAEQACGKPIVVAGSSLGCAAALCVAARR